MKNTKAIVAYIKLNIKGFLRAVPWLGGTRSALKEPFLFGEI